MNRYEETEILNEFFSLPLEEKRNLFPDKRDNTFHVYKTRYNNGTLSLQTKNSIIESMGYRNIWIKSK